MNLLDKLQALLAGKQSLLQTAALPENLRGYSVQQRIDESDKLLLELIKQIIAQEETKQETKANNTDDIPF